MGAMKPVSDALWALRKHYRVSLVEAEGIMCSAAFKVSVRSGRMAKANRTRVYDYPNVFKWCETHDVHGNELEAPVELAAALQVQPSEHEARVVARACRKELVEPGNELPDRPPYVDANNDPAAYKAWRAACKQREGSGISVGAQSDQSPIEGVQGRHGSQAGCPEAIAMSFFLPPGEPELRLFGKTRQIDRPWVGPFRKRPAARRKAFRSASGVTILQAANQTDGLRFEVCLPCTDLAGYPVDMNNGNGWLSAYDQQGRTYYLTDREPADLEVPSYCELERNRRRRIGYPVKGRDENLAPLGGRCEVTHRPLFDCIFLALVWLAITRKYPRKTIRLRITKAMRAIKMCKNSHLELVDGLKARRMTTLRIQYQILWRSPVSVDKNDFRLISRRKVAMRLGVQDYTVRDIEASDPSFPRRRRLVTKEKAAFFYREQAIEEWFASNLGKIETA